MIFWGSAIDPDKTRNYEVPNVDDVLPPTEAPMRPINPSPTATKQHPKPTSHLPGDHGTKEGENSKPAFGDPTSTPSATATGMTPTPDEGWFSDMSNLVSNQKWLFGGLALLIVFGIGVGLFFYFRRRRAISDYDRLGTNEMSMSALAARGSTGGTGRTRELYDAFGEVSDDDDDEADESTGLRRPQVPGRSTEGLGFHSGFLDDEEDPAVTGDATPGRQHYHDDSSGEDSDDDASEEKGGEDTKLISSTGGHSSSTSTSGEESWEHASTSRA